MERVGTICQLWRYPVKSMQGEALAEVVLEDVGVAGDRRFAVASTAAPAGKPLLSGRERAAMLRFSAQGTSQPRIAAPDGTIVNLSPCSLPAFPSECGAELRLVHSPARPLTDIRPVSLVSTATLRGLAEQLQSAVDPQRFRSNILLALDDDLPFSEDDFTGRSLCFGSPEGPRLRIQERIPRCRIVSLDPRSGEADPLLLRHLARTHGGRLGIYASVQRPGPLRVGDPVFCS